MTSEIETIIIYELEDFSSNLKTKIQADLFIKNHASIFKDDEWWKDKDKLVLDFSNVRKISDEFIINLFLPILNRFRKKEKFENKVSIIGNKLLVIKIYDFINRFFKIST